MKIPYSLQDRSVSQPPLLSLTPQPCWMKTPKTFEAASMVFTACYKEHQAAGFWSWKPCFRMKYMKEEREDRLNVDVMGKDTMIFLELMELISKLPSL